MRQIPAQSAIITSHPLFDGLPLERIGDLLHETASPVCIPQGAPLHPPDPQTRALAFLLSGRALVYKVAGDSRVLMSRLVPGSVFGMATLFSPQAVPPTQILAESACEVLLWPRAQVEAAFDAEPRLWRNYATLLSERIDFLNRRIETLTGDDLPARLYRLLEGLRGDTAYGAFMLPFTLSQLAQLLGASRATLYRAMDTLENTGAIARHGRSITLHTFHNEKEDTP